VDEGGRIGPAEVAATILGSGILGFLGQVLDLFALLQFGDDGLGLVFGFDQDVARLVFLVAELGRDFGVFLLDLLVGESGGP
jgi:hypothetical protein